MSGWHTVVCNNIRPLTLCMTAKGGSITSPQWHLQLAKPQKQVCSDFLPVNLTSDQVSIQTLPSHKVKSTSWSAVFCLSPITLCPVGGEAPVWLDQWSSSAASQLSLLEWVQSVCRESPLCLSLKSTGLGLWSIIEITQSHNHHHRWRDFQLQNLKHLRLTLSLSFCLPHYFISSSCFVLHHMPYITCHFLSICLTFYLSAGFYPSSNLV